MSDQAIFYEKNKFYQKKRKKQRLRIVDIISNFRRSEGLPDIPKILFIIYQHLKNGVDIHMIKYFMIVQLMEQMVQYLEKEFLIIHIYIS